MGRKWLTFLVILCLNGPLTAQEVAAPAILKWHGTQAMRLVVRVAVEPGLDRLQDELPAQLKLDFSMLSPLGRTPDLGSVRVVRIDPASGAMVADGDYAYGQPGDRPFRWYDHAIPYDFPETPDAISRTSGKIVRKSRLRGGYFFNAIGGWKRGRLAWVHTQHRDKPYSWYAIYFDWLKKNQRPSRLPPRGWLGDGLPRCDQESSTTMGADHSRLELDDWNGDGLVDLIVGEHYGHIFWWPNLGSPSEPKFRYAKFVFADGLPLDAGIGAAPKCVDFDGDGVKDLIVGTHWNRLLFYKNVGSNQDRRFSFQGPVMLDGAPLQTPLRPMERGSSNVFKRDYYPVPEMVDWDGDGDQDLLLGGYITGAIFYYQNLGPDEKGLPKLRLEGPINADGKTLNVRHWCASPCAVDLDGDGDQDLLSGNMPMHLSAAELANGEDLFLQYFENRGPSVSGTPRFASIRFPKEGTFPRDRLATPRTWDWDDDGDLDLVVSARQNIYLFRNIGDKHQPIFKVSATPLSVPWGLAPVAADQFQDWNGDGHLDRLRGYTVHLNSGIGNPYRWPRRESVLPAGDYISHPSGIGDDWFWPFVDDFDQDGRKDVLFGDWHGNVWLHRKLKDAPSRFDLKGFRLRLDNGDRIKVGPVNKDPDRDFDALQGARTVLTTGDFDRDGRRDLVVGDCYGKVRFFAQSPKRGSGLDSPTFLKPVEIADLGIRGLVDTVDWNQDGWPDVIASAANGRVRVILNTRSATNGRRFADGFDPKLPPIQQPRVLTADLNGDGDDDLFLPSTQGSCYIERSFLKHGYAVAELVKVEVHPRDQ